jgi:polynucleotide 5'-hydroxyl-kinase GRC3/NOL9
LEQIVEPNKTLVVNGPANIKFLEGKTKVLGVYLPKEKKVTIRRWRALPFYCELKSKFDFSLGHGASIEEVEGDTIPKSWYRVANMIVNHCKGQVKIATVIGGIDVGKTTFTSFLANIAFQNSLKVKVIDGDIGQSDIGPPTTIGMVALKNCIFDFFHEIPLKIIFVGAITPAPVKDKMLKGIAKLCEEARSSSDLIILNTDGWIEGKEAEKYKIDMIQKIQADFIVGINSLGELNYILEAVKNLGFSIFEIRPSPIIRKRNREDRKELRKQGYNRYLQKSFLKIISLKSVELDRPVAWNYGTLLGLFGNEEKFIGLGILEGYDLERGTVKIRTPAKGKVKRIEVGRVILKNGEEVSIF